MKNKYTQKQYSQCVVLCCLAANENIKIPVHFKDSLEGLKQKWRETQNDPTCSRLQIIYLSPTDTPKMQKFSPLKTIDRNSRIYIYGHSRPGRNGFYSDSHAYYEDASNNKINVPVAEFTYPHIANILLHNIINPEVRLNRFNLATHHLLHAQLRRLKISMIACSTNLDEKNLQGQVVNKALGDKLFNYLINHNEQYALLCDFVTANASIFPRPYRVDNHSKEFLKTFFNYYHSPKNESDIYFHKRYKRRFFIKGNWEFNPVKLFPRHQYTDHYKAMYVIPSSTTPLDLINKNLSYYKLNVPEAEAYFQRQTAGEKALSLLNAILEGPPGTNQMNAANSLRQAILNPDITEQALSQLVSDVEQNQYQPAYRFAGMANR